MTDYGADHKKDSDEHRCRDCGSELNSARGLSIHAANSLSCDPETAVPWKNEETLRELYRKNMSHQEIGDHFGIAHSAITRAFSELGIESRSRSQAVGGRYDVHVSIDAYGYEVARNVHHRKQYVLKMHRLAAVAWFGWDEVVDAEIHHKNGIKWDNREENLTALTSEDHRAEHNDTHDAPWKDKERVEHAYQYFTLAQLGERWGCTKGAISYYMDKFGLERRGVGKKPPKDPEDFGESQDTVQSTLYSSSPNSTR
jgi:hypothetical protein